MSLRDHIYQIMEGESDCLLSKVITSIVMIAIVVSSIAFVLESVPEYHQNYRTHFYWIEVIVVIIFSMEYIIRFLTVRKRLQFIAQPLNIVDLLAIAPFYLDILLSTVLDLRIIRIIRLIRIFRLFKLNRYSQSFAITLRTLQQSIHALSILLVLVALVLILFSSIMYALEHDAHISYCGNWVDGKYCHGQWIEGRDDPNQPKCPICNNPVVLPTGSAQVARNFSSIPKTFWWCIVTITTVGYGDVVPQTNLGKVLAGFTMLIGILCIALPTGVIATTFLNLLEEQRKKNQQPKEENQTKESNANVSEITCPHCQHKFLR